MRADLTDPATWTKLDYPLQKSGMYNGEWQLGTGHGMWSHDEGGNLIYVFHNAEYATGDTAGVTRRYGASTGRARACRSSTCSATRNSILLMLG